MQYVGEWLASFNGYGKRYPPALVVCASLWDRNTWSILGFALTEFETQPETAWVSFEVQLAGGETSTPEGTDRARIMGEARGDPRGSVLARPRGCLEATAPSVVRGQIGGRAPQTGPAVLRAAVPQPAAQSPPQDDARQVQHREQDGGKGAVPRVRLPVIRHRSRSSQRGAETVPQSHPNFAQQGLLGGCRSDAVQSMDAALQTCKSAKLQTDTAPARACSSSRQTSSAPCRCINTFVCGYVAM